VKGRRAASRSAKSRACLSSAQPAAEQHSNEGGVALAGGRGVSLAHLEQLASWGASNARNTRWTPQARVTWRPILGSVASSSGNSSRSLERVPSGSPCFFQAQVSYSLSSNPSSSASAILVADFNHDGRLDLATANTGSNDVSVLFGNGDGTFAAAVLYRAAPSPVAIVAGDFNGDGDLDLVSGFNTVQVLFGGRNGTFVHAINHRVGFGASIDDQQFATSIAPGDFNDDGKLDLATNDAGILLGKGDGTFAAPLPYGEQFSLVAAGDFDADGKLDIAAATPGNVAVLLGNGDGTLRSAVDYAVGGNTSPSSLPTSTATATSTSPAPVKGTAAIAWRCSVEMGDGTFQPSVHYNIGWLTTTRRS
jgi:VCBS repeat protein